MMWCMDTPYTSKLVRQDDGSWAVVCRAVFMVPEGTDLSAEEAIVEREAVRAAHIAAADLVRDGIVPS